MIDIIVGDREPVGIAPGRKRKRKPRAYLDRATCLRLAFALLDAGVEHSRIARILSKVGDGPAIVAAALRQREKAAAKAAKLAAEDVAPPTVTSDRRINPTPHGEAERARRVALERRVASILSDSVREMIAARRRAEREVVEASIARGENVLNPRGWVSPRSAVVENIKRVQQLRDLEARMVSAKSAVAGPGGD